MQDFMEFEMEKNIFKFNLDDNESMLMSWDKKDVMPWMKDYVSTTFYFERGAWTYEFLHSLMHHLVTQKDWTNYEIGTTAYELTLAKHHTWFLQQGVKICLLAIKDKDEMIKMYMKEQEGIRNNGKPYTVRQTMSDIKEFSVVTD